MDGVVESKGLGGATVLGDGARENAERRKSIRGDMVKQTVVYMARREPINV